ncbi:DUF1642 domain-containing protein [Lactiplantibacillus plantarum]|uniref:DUF1642 domain-containing protein n=1 Tax=Lactiplantibacillus plantarum TaxID=1590 RepID=UPI00222E78FE|nr:DUF1642 domain-containing protein [Lactiplantibacillus plantarum]UZF04072.1 DUF1642 domain-containing protein [Lactiplantibacillus plantarum]WJM30638.1 DUF1642 domain-containing protein [Lactiplantibacillus plantarum]
MKFYRKQPIKAEQFDGSDKMADKYELIDAGTMFGTHHSPELYLTGSGKVDVGDWIATGVNGEHWPIADDVFKKTYAELPVIPKAVADYMKYCKNPINLFFHSALYEAFDELFAASHDVEHWIDHNSDVFARAWLDGYVVEK